MQPDINEPIVRLNNIPAGGSGTWRGACREGAKNPLSSAHRVHEKHRFGRVLNDAPAFASES